MHFWLSRGVSGFRMDVINLISKDPAYPDAPIVEPDCDFQPGEQFYTNGPRFHEFMHGIYDNVLSKYDTITVGETNGKSLCLGSALAYIGSSVPYPTAVASDVGRQLHVRHN